MAEADNLNIRLIAKDDKHPLLNSFLRVANNTLAILRKLDASQAIEWRVEGLSLSSPLEIAIGDPAAPAGEVDDAVGLYIDLFSALVERRQPNPRIPLAALEPARKLVMTLEDGISEIAFTGAGKSVRIPSAEAVKATIKSMLAPPSDMVEITTIEGELRTISIDGGLKVFIYDRLTNDQIECDLDQTTYDTRFNKDNMGRRASMYGQVYFKAGKPHKIRVRRYEFLPSCSEPSSPGPSNIVIAGDMDSVDYIRKLRDDG